MVKNDSWFPLEIYTLFSEWFMLISTQNAPENSLFTYLDGHCSVLDEEQGFIHRAVTFQ